jgi:zinc transport system ATP-binding protein
MTLETLSMNAKNKSLVPSDPIISIKGLWAGYDAHPVLEDIHFEMFQGDYIGLIGPNGGGKTTLIKVILGLVPVMRGELKVWGKSPAEARDRLGYVPQISRSDKDFPISVWDVVRMGRQAPGFRLSSRLSSKSKQAIEKALSQAGVLNLAKRSFNQLSGGQRQRVLIARALATEPDLLILDEPTASVDSQSTAKLYELLAELNQHLSILLVSHDLMAISTHVKTIGCVNSRMVYHNQKMVTKEMLDLSYDCPVDLLAHGLPHRVLHEHHHEDSANSLSQYEERKND